MGEFVEEGGDSGLNVRDRDPREAMFCGLQEKERRGSEVYVHSDTNQNTLRRALLQQAQQQQEQKQQQQQQQQDEGLLLHIHPSCSAAACGQEAPCSGYRGTPHSSLGRRIGTLSVRGGPHINHAAWRVLLLSQQQQQQQQKQQQQQEGRPLGFASFGVAEAARLTRSSGRLSCKSASSGTPAAAAAATATATAAAAAGALLVAPLHPGRQTGVSWSSWGLSKRTAAAYPLFAAVARGATAKAAAAAAPAAYGSRKYRLILLVSGKLSVPETQSRVLYRGLRGLGSPISKEDTAHFVEILFEALPQALHPLRLSLQQDARILRFMFLNLEKHGRPEEDDAITREPVLILRFLEQQGGSFTFPQELFGRRMRGHI
ncbi:hypothetical protein Esti_006695 [Eimeria stiedai]